MAIVKDKALLRRIAENGGRADCHGARGHRHRPGGAGGGGAAHLRHPPGPVRPGSGPHLQRILNVYERLNELAASDSAVPARPPACRRGYMAISGLNKSDLILLAARPGMGKTSFALNMLLHAGKFSGKTVVFFSLEMSRGAAGHAPHLRRELCGQQKLVTGKLGRRTGPRSPPPRRPSTRRRF